MNSNIDKNQTQDDGVDLFKLLFIIWQNKKLVSVITISTVFVTIIISLFITPVYRAHTSLMALSTNASMIQVQNLKSGLSFGEWSDETKRVIAVLNSRTIVENVVKRLDLDREVDEEYIEKRISFLRAVNVLNKSKVVNYDKKSGLITLSIEHQNPEKARDIANVYIEELQNILNSKSFSVSRAKREFIEKQLVLFEKRLKKKQKRLAKFQKTSKLISPKEQVKDVIKLYAELISKKTALEIELKSIETALAPNSPILVSIKNQIKAINYRIGNLVGSKSMGALPSLESIPGQIVKYEDVSRDIEITKTIYENMLKLYEQSKIEEAQEGLYIQIIDPAIKPIGRAKPNRRLIVISSAVISFFFSSFMIFFLRWLKTVELLYSNYQKNK